MLVQLSCVSVTARSQSEFYADISLLKYHNIDIGISIFFDHYY